MNLAYAGVRNPECEFIEFASYTQVVFRKLEQFNNSNEFLCWSKSLSNRDRKFMYLVHIQLRSEFIVLYTGGFIE